jgi:hypothetical protein
MRRLQQVVGAINMGDRPVVVVLTRMDRDILVSDSLSRQCMTLVPTTIQGVPFVSDGYVRNSYLVRETVIGPRIEML